MSNISKFLKMNSEQLGDEINKQNKKIANAKETISLLKKLQIAADSNSVKASTPVPKYDEARN